MQTRIKELNTSFMVPILLGIAWMGIMTLIWIRRGEFPSIQSFAIVAFFFAPQFFWAFKKALDKSKSIPLKDELIRMIDIYASAYTFKISIWVWFAIYFFRAEFPDPGKMVFFGILSSFLIFGLSRFYLRTAGPPHANQN